MAGIVSGASPAYNVEEMTYALKTGRAKFLMTVPGSMEVAAAAAEAAGIKKENVFLLEGKIEGFTTMNELLEIGKSYGESNQVPAYELEDGESNFDLCAFLSFSSGTTGLPKAVSLARLPNLVFTGPRAKLLSKINTGHDCTPECHCPMPSNPTNYSSIPQESPCRPSLLPHYRTDSCASSSYSAECGSLHAPILYHEVHAGYCD